jgi:hypothetical protein
MKVDILELTSRLGLGMGSMDIHSKSGMYIPYTVVVGGHSILLTEEDKVMVIEFVIHFTHFGN